MCRSHPVLAIALAIAADGTLNQPAQQGTQHQRHANGGRQVDAQPHSQRRQCARAALAQQHIGHDGGHTDGDAQAQHVPVQIALEDAVGNLCHQGGLRCSQRLRCVHAFTGQCTSKAVGVVEQLQHRRNHHGTDHAASGARGLSVLSHNARCMISRPCQPRPHPRVARHGSHTCSQHLLC